MVLDLPVMRAGGHDKRKELRKMLIELALICLIPALALLIPCVIVEAVIQWPARGGRK